MDNETIGHFLGELASAAPTPGGGAVAALSAAFSAALVAMVCELTTGRDEYLDLAPLMRMTVEKATDLRENALSLAIDDEEAYAAVIVAYALPRTTEAEKIDRVATIQRALKSATDVPLSILDLCARVIDLCSEIVEVANRNAISDVGVAALHARAAIESAAFNIKINLRSLRDETYAMDARERMTALLVAAGTGAQAVVHRVESRIEEGR